MQSVKDFGAFVMDVSALSNSRNPDAEEMRAPASSTARSSYELQSIELERGGGCPAGTAGFHRRKVRIEVAHPMPTVIGRDASIQQCVINRLLTRSIRP
jgi:hypothetical protein